MIFEIVDIGENNLESDSQGKDKLWLLLKYRFLGPISNSYNHSFKKALGDPKES